MPLDALAGDPFDALGDPHRRAIVELLRDGDRTVGHIAEALPISRPAVSRHLRLLERAGLVEGRADGSRRVYRLDDAGIAALRSYLEAVWGEAAARFRLAADNLPHRPEAGSYGLRKGMRGRFGVYVPPVLEALGLAEVEHQPRNNRMRAR